MVPTVEELFGTLFRLKKGAQFVRYWGEGHQLATSPLAHEFKMGTVSSSSGEAASARIKAVALTPESPMIDGGNIP